MLEASDAMEAATAKVLRAGGLEIRPDEFTALANGKPIMLTARELALLTALVERQDRIVSRAELYSDVWQSRYRKSDRSATASSTRTSVSATASHLFHRVATAK